MNAEQISFHLMMALRRAQNSNPCEALLGRLCAEYWARRLQEARAAWLAVTVADLIEPGDLED